MPQDLPSIPSSPDGVPASGEIAPGTSQGEDPIPAGPIRGIGIGIESVTIFPETEDYREHEFYQARFTPAEFAACSGGPLPRASFCALSAVKRAVVKAGAVTPAPETLAAIEITIDEAGNPSRPGCVISVDRTEETAVAVCLWTREWSGSPAAAPVAPGRPLASFPPLQRLGIRLLMGLAGLSLLFVFGAGAWFILNQVFH